VSVVVAYLITAVCWLAVGVRWERDRQRARDCAKEAREAAEDQAFEERMWRELKARLLTEQRQRDTLENRARLLPPRWRDAAYAKRN